MSVSGNNNLQAILSAPVFDIPISKSASQRFNTHLHNLQSSGSGGRGDGSGANRSCAPLTPATTMCEQCGGISGHSRACTAVMVGMDDLPITNKWGGKVVMLHAWELERTPLSAPVAPAPPTAVSTVPCLMTGHPLCNCEQCQHRCQHCSEDNNTSTSTSTSTSTIMLLNELPEPILVLIFKHLGYQALGRAAQVCRALFFAGTDPSLWRTLELDGYMVTDDVLVRLCSRTTYTNVLSIDGGYSNTGGVTAAGLSALTDRYCLVKLSLQNCRAVAEDTIAAVVAKNGNKLRCINLKNCRQVTDATLSTMGMHARKVTSLNLMGCKKVSDVGLAQLACLTTLRELNLWGGGRWTEQGGLMGLIRSCKRLELLELRFCKVVTDSTVKEIAKHCERIERLGLAYCTALTDTSLDVLMESCPKLLWLNVRDCPRISVEARTRFQTQRPLCHLLFNKAD